MPTIRSVDPMLVQQYTVASVLASMFTKKNEDDADADIQQELMLANEHRKNVLAIAGLMLYVAVVFWPLMLAR